MKKIVLLILCAILLSAIPVGFAGSAEEAVRVTPAVSIGNHFMIALRADGTALAWGKNQHGVLGNGTTEDSSTPQLVTMPVSTQAAVRFSSVGAGYDHVIALATDGTVWTWGSDANGQLGNRAKENEPQSVTLPKQVGGDLEGKTVVSVAAGKAFSLALTSEGQVYAWGIN
jgi:alpha-tubulin suppressor-like RCC1 family protein